jgi:hypothetical protein
MAPLPLGSTLLDASETVDNIVISYINSSSPLISNIINLNTASNSSVLVGQIGRQVQKIEQTYSSPNLYIDSGISGAAYQYNNVLA